MRSFFARISRRTWIVAVVAALSLLLLGAGGAYVYAQASGTFAPLGTPSGQATPGGQRRGHGAHGAGKGGLLRRLLAQGISGSVKVKDASAPGGYATIAFAKGSITSVDTTSGALNLQEADGTTQSYSVPATARIQASGAKGTIADLHTGEQVIVITKQMGGGAPAVIAVVAQPVPNASSGGATPSASGA